MNLKNVPRKLAAMLARALHLGDEEGGAVLEFGLMVPPLILVLTGAASFSMAFYELQQLETAVSSAVQAVAAEQGVNPDPCNQAMTDIQAALPSFKTGSFTYTLTVTDSSSTASYTTSGGANGGATAYSCKAAGPGTASSPNTTTEMQANSPVVLTVSYAYNWLTIIPAHFFSPTTPLTVTETALAD
jgi:Flp pilus assembly protein TadG